MRRKGLVGRVKNSLEYSYITVTTMRYNLPEPDQEEFEKAREKVFSGGDNQK